jgi:hypothetical protein
MTNQPRSGKAEPGPTLRKGPETGHSGTSVRHGHLDAAAELPAPQRNRTNGRGERRQSAGTDLFVPARLPLEIVVTGVERWPAISA